MPGCGSRKELDDFVEGLGGGSLSSTDTTKMVRNVLAGKGKEEPCVRVDFSKEEAPFFSGREQVSPVLVRLSLKRLDSSFPYPGYEAGKEKKPVPYLSVVSRLEEEEWKGSLFVGMSFFNMKGKDMVAETVVRLKEGARVSYFLNVGKKTPVPCSSTPVFQFTGDSHFVSSLVPLPFEPEKSSVFDLESGVAGREAIVTYVGTHRLAAGAVLRLKEGAKETFFSNAAGSSLPSSCSFSPPVFLPVSWEDMTERMIREVVEGRVEKKKRGILEAREERRGMRMAAEMLGEGVFANGKWEAVPGTCFRANVSVAQEAKLSPFKVGCLWEVVEESDTVKETEKSSWLTKKSSLLKYLVGSSFPEKLKSKLMEGKLHFTVSELQGLTGNKELGDGEYVVKRGESLVRALFSTKEERKKGSLPVSKSGVHPLFSSAWEAEEGIVRGKVEKTSERETVQVGEGGGAAVLYVSEVVDGRAGRKGVKFLNEEDGWFVMGANPHFPLLPESLFVHGTGGKEQYYMNFRGMDMMRVEESGDEEGGVILSGEWEGGQSPSPGMVVEGAEEKEFGKMAFEKGGAKSKERWVLSVSNDSFEKMPPLCVARSVMRHCMLERGEKRGERKEEREEREAFCGAILWLFYWVLTSKLEECTALSEGDYEDLWAIQPLVSPLSNAGRVWKMEGDTLKVKRQEGGKRGPERGLPVCEWASSLSPRVLGKVALDLDRERGGVSRYTLAPVFVRKGGKLYSNYFAGVEKPELRNTCETKLLDLMFLRKGEGKGGGGPPLSHGLPSISELSGAEMKVNGEVWEKKGEGKGKNETWKKALERKIRTKVGEGEEDVVYLDKMNVSDMEGLTEKSIIYVNIKKGDAEKTFMYGPKTVSDEMKSYFEAVHKHTFIQDPGKKLRGMYDSLQREVARGLGRESELVLDPKPEDRRGNMIGNVAFGKRVGKGRAPPEYKAKEEWNEWEGLGGWMERYESVESFELK